jgi:hypothetical protein
VSGEAALALTARGVVDECDPAAVFELRDDLVPEDRACVRGVELLDVGAAESARDDADVFPRTVRLGDLCDRRLAFRPDDDGAHRRIVGSHLVHEGRSLRWRSSSIAVLTPG